jgi:hypothetical protein
MVYSRRKWWKFLSFLFAGIFIFLDFIGRIQTVSEVISALQVWIPVFRYFGLPSHIFAWIGLVCILIGIVSFVWPSDEGSNKFRPADDPASPFVTLNFPVQDLLSSEIRTDYVFVKNIGERPALDVQVADITKKWGDHTYIAKFPRLQILEGKGESRAVTPQVYQDGEHHPIFSMTSRVWFGALLIGDDAHIEYGKEVSHPISISYTDRGISKNSEATLVGKYVAMSIFVSIKDQH